MQSSCWIAKTSRRGKGLRKRPRMPMRRVSVYSVDCPCGHHLETETSKSVCPGCQRLVVIEWPAFDEDCFDLEVSDKSIAL
jgi:hypothetical protein